MTLFTVHRFGGRIRLVPERFCWTGLVFGPLALAIGGAWASALLLVLAWWGALHWHLPVVAWTLPVATGLFGFDWKRLELRLGGWIDDGVVAGKGRDHALLRLFDRPA